MESELRIIYLDNSHLHLLSEVRRTDPARFSKFMKMWAANKCALALSQTHLQEISRYDDQSKREARYDLLGEMLPIHCDIILADEVPISFLSLTNREIFSALIRRNMVSVQDQALIRYSQGLLERFTSKAHITLLRQLDIFGVWRNLIEAFYEANKVSAAANSRPPKAKYERPRLSQIGDTKIIKDDVTALLKQLEEEQVDIAQWESLRDLVPPELMNEVFGGIRNMIEQFAGRVDEVGSSNALAEFLGVDSADRTNSRKPLDLLIQQHTFEVVLRQFLADVCGEQDETRVGEVVRQLKMEDCPGTWLKNAVQIQIRKAVTEDEASNYYDLEHLAYLPYTDLFFADKRIAEFARQVLNSNQSLLSLKGIREPISVPSSVDAIESAISSLPTL
ncbi:MAG TPA: hypothetical protein VF528_20895 [Pyrinomonadaceae bacterium]|jgi:hypothetical protein